MLNYAFGDSDEEARSGKELAKAVLDVVVLELETSGFEECLLEGEVQLQGRTWRLELRDESPCPECGVTRPVYGLDGEELMRAAFCPNCWTLDLTRDGVKWAHATRELEKTARDLPPGFSATFTALGPDCTLKNPADRGDPDRPFDMAAFESTARATYQTGQQVWLGRISIQGFGGEPIDDARAVTWFRRAARMGHAEALNVLGYCLLKGRGVERDEVDAVALLRKAAARGQRDAMFSLANLYDEGHVLPKDRVAAAGWWRLAADAGLPAAQRSIGLSLLRGNGVPKDRTAAMLWLRKAAQAGDQDAIRAVADLEGDQPALLSAGESSK